MVNYSPQFNPPPWTDFVDTVQAGGSNGFNARFKAISDEFNSVSQVVSQLNAGLGAFQPLVAGGAVAYTGGANVGVGPNYSAANQPTHALEVSLGPNTGPAQQACFGNAVCCNGTATFLSYAMFAHQNHASNTDYALRQSPSGEVHINAASGQAVSIRQNGTSVRLGITTNGNVVVGSDSELLGAPAGATLQVQGDAYKSGGSGTWQTSDTRVKQDVRELEAGLAQLRQVRPVRFRYNGLAGTAAGREDVGILGQEIEKIFPEMIQLTSCTVDGEPDINDLRIFDGSALTFVLINAVKELATEVEELRQTLAEASRKWRLATTG